MEKRLIFPGEGRGVTQVATACMRAGQTVDLHAHETMDEYFYVLSGHLHIEVDGRAIDMDSGDCVRVNAREMHALKVGDSAHSVEFLYWGVATQK